jgi:hypothetical protein
VVDRRRPGRVVEVIVLGPERLEAELRRVEAKRDDEVRRDEPVTRYLGIVQGARTFTTTSV